MVRFLVVYAPPPDPAAFERHYREVHIPLAKKLPGLNSPATGVRSVIFEIEEV